VKLSSKSKLEGKIALITGGNSGIGLANSEEPTLASVWHSVAGSFISDELLKWPADVRSYGCDPRTLGSVSLCIVSTQ
jgi:hypothetical protein